MPPRERHELRVLSRAEIKSQRPPPDYLAVAVSCFKVVLTFSRLSALFFKICIFFSPPVASLSRIVIFHTRYDWLLLCQEIFFKMFQYSFDIINFVLNLWNMLFL